MFLKLFSKSKPQPDTDEELVRQYRQTGNLDFVGILFERHTEMVYLICYKYLQDEDDSKDAAMQLFENLTESLIKHEVTNFKSWLHATTKNHCLMQLRRQKNKDFKKNNIDISGEVMQNNPAWHLNSDDNQELEAEVIALEKGIKTIPAEQQQCVALFYLQQKSYKEITQITGYDLNKVRSHIQNGRRNLKIYLQKYHETQ